MAATTGKGGAINSAWFLRRKSRIKGPSTPLLYKNDSNLANTIVWNDWFFPAVAPTSNTATTRRQPTTCNKIGSRPVQ